MVARHSCSNKARQRKTTREIFSAILEKIQEDGYETSEKI